MTASVAMQDGKVSAMSGAQSLRHIKHFEGCGLGARLTTIQPLCPATPNIRFTLPFRNQPCSGTISMRLLRPQDCRSSSMSLGAHTIAHPRKTRQPAARFAH